VTALMGRKKVLTFSFWADTVMLHSTPDASASGKRTPT